MFTVHTQFTNMATGHTTQHVSLQFGDSRLKVWHNLHWQHTEFEFNMAPVSLDLPGKHHANNS